MYRERFKLLQQRIARHRMLTKPSFECGGSRANDATRAYCELTPLTGLLGAAGETRYVDKAVAAREGVWRTVAGRSRSTSRTPPHPPGCSPRSASSSRRAKFASRTASSKRARWGSCGQSREESGLAAMLVDFVRRRSDLRTEDIARLLKSEASSGGIMFVVSRTCGSPRAPLRLRAVFEGFDSWTPRRQRRRSWATSARPVPPRRRRRFRRARFGVFSSGTREALGRLASLIEEFERLREERRSAGRASGRGDRGSRATGIPRPKLFGDVDAPTSFRRRAARDVRSNPARVRSPITGPRLIANALQAAFYRAPCSGSHESPRRRYEGRRRCAGERRGAKAFALAKRAKTAARDERRRALRRG